MPDRKPIVVVSGLPRSGTSMVMQMLHAGGIEVMTDAVRTADADNPHGYLEFERVKQLKSDKSWLDDAAGKAVKVIHLLLMELPTDREYKVIFVRRELQEVVKSQSVMLERMGRKGAAIAPELLMATFERQLKSVDAWLAERPNFEVLRLDHRLFITDAASQARAIGEFLGGGIDQASMVRAVDPSLHRNRV